MAEQYCLKWNNHQTTLVSVFTSLLDSGNLSDCILSAEGESLQAHQVVISACSPYLDKLLNANRTSNQFGVPILIFNDLKIDELRAMREYMYKGEVNIAQENLNSFLRAAQALQIKGLAEQSGSNSDRSGERGLGQPLAKRRRRRTRDDCDSESSGCDSGMPSAPVVPPVQTEMKEEGPSFAGSIKSEPPDPGQPPTKSEPVQDLTVEDEEYDTADYAHDNSHDISNWQMDGSMNSEDFGPEHSQNTAATQPNSQGEKSAEKRGYRCACKKVFKNINHFTFHVLKNHCGKRKASQQQDSPKEDKKADEDGRNDDDEEPQNGPLIEDDPLVSEELSSRPRRPSVNEESGSNRGGLKVVSFSRLSDMFESRPGPSSAEDTPNTKGVLKMVSLSTLSEPPENRPGPSYAADDCNVTNKGGLKVVDFSRLTDPPDNRLTPPSNDDSSVSGLKVVVFSRLSDASSDRPGTSSAQDCGGSSVGGLKVKAFSKLTESPEHIPKVNPKGTKNGGFGVSKFSRWSDPKNRHLPSTPAVLNGPENRSNFAGQSASSESLPGPSSTPKDASGPNKGGLKFVEFSRLSEPPDCRPGPSASEDTPNRVGLKVVELSRLSGHGIDRTNDKGIIKVVNISRLSEPSDVAGPSGENRSSLENLNHRSLQPLSENSQDTSHNNMNRNQSEGVIKLISLSRLSGEQNLPESRPSVQANEKKNFTKNKNKQKKVKKPNKNNNKKNVNQARLNKKKKCGGRNSEISKNYWPEWNENASLYPADGRESTPQAQMEVQETVDLTDSRECPSRENQSASPLHLEAPHINLDELCRAENRAPSESPSSISVKRMDYLCGDGQHPHEGRPSTSGSRKSNNNRDEQRQMHNRHFSGDMYPREGSPNQVPLFYRDPMDYRPDRRNWWENQQRRGKNKDRRPRRNFRGPREGGLRDDYRWSHWDPSPDRGNWQGNYSRHFRDVPQNYGQADFSSDSHLPMSQMVSGVVDKIIPISMQQEEVSPPHLPGPSMPNPRPGPSSAPDIPVPIPPLDLAIPDVPIAQIELRASPPVVPNRLETNSPASVPSTSPAPEQRTTSTPEDVPSSTTSDQEKPRDESSTHPWHIPTCDNNN